MGNRITEKYFKKSDFPERIDQILAELEKQTGFQNEKLIFTGKIYDDDKVWSKIYKGTYKDQPAVLKLQGLPPEIDESEIIQKFTEQNTSSKIRLPKIYESAAFSEEKGYGYILMEYVKPSPPYQYPFATDKEIKEFTEFYQDYKENCLKTPLFPVQNHEKSALVFTTQRISHWSKIAEHKQTLSENKVQLIEKFLIKAAKHLPHIKMEFMHGHLENTSIHKTTSSEYVLTSNLFWSYRPEYYDTTFHLWAALKSIDDTQITSEQVTEYIDKWIQAYLHLPVIQKDPDFEKKFHIQLLERLIGAILVDIENNPQLTNLFTELFEHYHEKIS